MARGTSATAPTLIGSVQRALRLLEAAACHPDGAPAKQLAREAGIPLPTAYHLLRTLAHDDYLRREHGVFVLGGAVGALLTGESVQNRRGRVEEALAYWRDAIGAPVYLARYRAGEIEIVACADSPGTPAVEEWADLRETAHAHAIGQCLLSRLDPASRREHLDRHPVVPLTRHSAGDRRTLLRRLDSLERFDSAGRPRPVVERQEYTLGTVCAAVPIAAGADPVAMAISLPLHQEERLLPAIEQLRDGVGGLLGALTLSISI
ncbi:helix-turn-helix domain-containing protein [Streptomyces sp. NPDC001985]|uniref:IclR family transcriptional regulator n=1 Tax=Streptomyces sp. NPDC001985 TaxID=3154406 RepID=UPI00333261CB